MFEEMTEQQAREQILEMTKEYCEKYHNQKMGKKTGGSLCFLHYNKSRSPLDRARVK